MQAPHGGGGATALGDRIYAVGGLANGAASTLCDVLEPERDHWTPLPMLNRTRYNCAVTALGGSLYCAGGYDNQVYLSTMERLDPREGKRWTEVKLFRLITNKRDLYHYAWALVLRNNRI